MSDISLTYSEELAMSDSAMNRGSQPKIVLPLFLVYQSDRTETKIVEVINEMKLLAMS